MGFRHHVFFYLGALWNQHPKHDGGGTLYTFRYSVRRRHDGDSDFSAVFESFFVTHQSPAQHHPASKMRPWF